MIILSSEPTSATVLATASEGTVQADTLFRTLAPWLGLLVLVVVAGGIVIVLVRRYMRNDPRANESFSLEDLRQMHRRGEMDDEEFARAKAILLGRAREITKDDRGRSGWEESGRRGDPDGPREHRPPDA